MSPFKSFPPVGSEAPAFTLRDATGIEHSTAAARGKWLVIYFYPKDDTPGCTIEACEFRDSETALQAAGAKVVAFEPLPPAFARLRAAVAVRGITVWVVPVVG